MNSTSIPDTVKQILTSRIALFAGAGVSFDPPSRLPDFQMLSRTIIKNIVGNNVRLDDIEVRPEVILQIAVDEVGPKVLRSLHVLSGHSPNANHFYLAEALRRGNPVFTTNVDNLIEEACETRGIEYERYYDDEYFARLANKLANRERKSIGYLFKLHGTIEEGQTGDDRYRSILVALNQVGRGLSEPKTAVLQHFIKELDFCFIGYSCQDDFSVLPVLMETKSSNFAYWLSTSTSATWQVKLKRELSTEKKKEERRGPGEQRSWKIINTNGFLVRRKNSCKIVGDWPKLVKDVICPILGVDVRRIPSVSKPADRDEEFAQWVSRTTGYEKSMIMGRLYHSLYDLNGAESYYTKALYETTDDAKKATAGRRLGDLCLIPSTAIGDEKAIAAYAESLKIYERLSDKFSTACAATDLANALRRRKRYSEAMRYAQQAVGLLENQTPSGSLIEAHKLAYARCLNVMGLVYFGLASEKDLLVASELCEKSKLIKEDLGDVEGIGDSENALGLILGEHAWLAARNNRQETTPLFQHAIDHLRSAIDRRKKTGNTRGCFQHCRNLGLIHSRLASLSTGPSEKKNYVRLTKKDFKDGMSYLNNTKPEPPPGDSLECQFRLGELSVQLGQGREAVAWLGPVEEKRREPKEWHNRARALDLLCKAHGHTEDGRLCALELMSIYREVVCDASKIREMQQATIKLKNAIDILAGTAKLLDEIALTDFANEARKLSRQLNEEVGGPKTS